MMMGGFPQAPAFRRPSGFVYSYQTYDNYPASTAPLTVPAVAPSEVPAEGTPQAIAAPQFYNPYGPGGFGGYPFAGYNGLTMVPAAFITIMLLGALILMEVMEALEDIL